MCPRPAILLLMRRFRNRQMIYETAKRENSYRKFGGERGTWMVDDIVSESELLEYKFTNLAY